MNTKNEIEIFKFESLGDVRIKLDEKGEPWFCLSDICNILGVNKTADTMKRLDQKGSILSTPLQTEVYKGFRI